MTVGLAAPALQDRSRRSLQRIVSAAEMVLRRDGVDGFSIAAIADASGISVGGIYARVKGKNELYELIKKNAVQNILANTIRKLRGRHDSAAAVVESFIEASTTILARDERLHKALFAQGAVQQELGVSGAAARKETIDVFVDKLIAVTPAFAVLDRRWLTFGGDMMVATILDRMQGACEGEATDWKMLQCQLKLASTAYFVALLRDDEPVSSRDREAIAPATQAEA